MFFEGLNNSGSLGAAEDHTRALSQTSTVMRYCACFTLHFADSTTCTLNLTVCPAVTLFSARSSLKLEGRSLIRFGPSSNCCKVCLMRETARAWAKRVWVEDFPFQDTCVALRDPSNALSPAATVVRRETWSVSMPGHNQTVSTSIE